jgi:outer membrane protein W
LSVVIAGLPIVIATPAVAQDDVQAEATAQTEEEPGEAPPKRERNWRVRFTGAVAGDRDGIIASSVDGSGNWVSISGSVGAGVNFEYRFKPRMGFEVGAIAMAGGVDVGVGKHHRYSPGVEVGGYVPLTFDFNYHPFDASEIFDLYIGPLAATTFVSGVGIDGGVHVGSRVDLGLGANLGFDINLGKQSRWSLNSGIKYIADVTRNDSDSRLASDPLIWTFGFGFKF